MNDADFLAAFEAGTLSNSEFRHGGHLRMAWLYLRRDGPERGGQAALDGLRRFAATKGAFALYNETLTRFWVRAVAHHVLETPSVVRFDDFLVAFPALTDKTLVYRHFRPESLSNSAARAGWQEPDLRPLPAGM